MFSARGLAASRRYLLPPLLAGAGLAAARRRAAIPVLAGAAAVLLFFRDPDRPLDPRPGLVYAPTDGIVTHVDHPAAAGWLPGGPHLRISTFLAVHHVHVARSPAAGLLAGWSWIPGRCRAAARPSASAGNRQARLAIQAGEDTIGLVLVAGAVARRISAWAAAGDRLAAGTRVGIIHFGSRCDTLLPAGRYEPLVRRGARLTGGWTPIARKLPAAGCP